MANQIIPMSKLKKFLKLSLEGKSLRQISELTGMSRNTIFKYNDLLSKHPLSQKELAKLSDKELYSIVYSPAVKKQTHEVLYGLFPEIDVQLSRIGVTKFMLWKQYIRGLINYYHKFWQAGMRDVWNGLNHRLLKWVKWEKGLYNYASVRWLRNQYKETPNLFAHWKLVQP